MATKKPTILFIPGAWFHPSAYDDFISLLQDSSFPTTYAAYPSLNPSDPAKADAAADTHHVLQESLFPLIENEGKDVVIVMHSYGGVPGSAAAKGLSKFRRTHEGKRGGVVGMIHISGFVLPGGASVADGQGGQLPEWVKENEVRSPSLRSPSLPSRSG
jgi:pimeloyl-ACP methyl ester carboxylesterase